MFIPLAKLAESAKFAWPVAAASCASEPHLAAKTPSITKNMCTWHIYCIYTFTLNLICFCGFAASEFVQMPACCFESWQNSKDATQSCQSPASASRKSLRRPLGNRNSFQTNAMQSKLKKMSSLCCILKLKNLYISINLPYFTPVCQIHWYQQTVFALFSPFWVSVSQFLQVEEQPALAKLFYHVDVHARHRCRQLVLTSHMWEKQSCWANL